MSFIQTPLSKNAYFCLWDHLCCQKTCVLWCKPCGALPSGAIPAGQHLAVSVSSVCRAVHRGVKHLEKQRTAQIGQPKCSKWRHLDNFSFSYLREREMETALFAVHLVDTQRASRCQVGSHKELLSPDTNY